MDEWGESPQKKEDDNPIKEEILEDEGKKLSRDIARKYIYVRNKEKYPLPFEEYKLYHIDGKLFNDSPDNLYLCTKEQRKALYAEQLKRKRPFESSQEIDDFLEKIGKISPEISKDKKIYEKKYNPKIPLYWKQRETRKRQFPPIDPHPELRERLVEEIRKIEDDIEEKKEQSRFYTLPPKRHPELKKKLIDELKDAKYMKENKKRIWMTTTQKVIIVAVILIVICIFVFAFKDFLSKKGQIQDKPFDISKSKVQTNVSSEQKFNYEIRTERYFILVINNEDKDLDIEITYNRFSRGLDINENKTVQAYVPAKGNILLKDAGFSRDLGCLKNDCEVSIISSNKI